MDDELNDDILELLSRPSSATSRSKKNKTRKKVTFSNDDIVQNRVDINNEIDDNPSTKLKSDSFRNNDDKSVEEEDALPSFSRSVRVGHGYSPSVDDINDLFRVNE